MQKGAKQSVAGGAGDGGSGVDAQPAVIARKRVINARLLHIMQFSLFIPAFYLFLFKCALFFSLIWILINCTLHATVCFTFLFIFWKKKKTGIKVLNYNTPIRNLKGMKAALGVLEL